MEFLASRITVMVEVYCEEVDSEQKVDTVFTPVVQHEKVMQLHMQVLYVKKDFSLFFF